MAYALDKEHIEWLVDYLKNFSGAFIVISHDFDFLDKITNKEQHIKIEASSGLSQDEIEKEVRLLSILDVFDALTARDRPYKPPMPVEKALFVLQDMVKFGELDGEILELFKDSGAWE